jgi:3-hydroxyacyl-CoA dehydrogenase
MEVRTIAMIGAGVMGHGIAQVLATAGYDVRLYDIRAEALTAALERIDTGR